ncbi:ArnT family glycosyltransferase [Pyrococcus abyssi]|uniref:Transmembrane transport protein n=1 Tax=Pyrococcus abyssi (strain GE5 / Orsay) TaxID=272844 RepID=Q9UZC2_PYRAB|nr:glycosyltransferase family 39 protein [Pyrococcus abyssi]CAB50137.1 Hypothetical protein PAB1564 [Pyrococcus abyssi GE5]CCE70666.1 TPA: transmembrane transport protein [Pyrococcus abyssi GE5]
MGRGKVELLWLLLIAFIVNFAVIYGRKMPVGANGGDTIIHMAMIRGIYLGRNPFLDQHYNVPPNWYPFLYHSLIAILAKFTSIPIWTLMIWTPLIFSIIMVFAWYKLGRELNEKYGGLLLGSLSFLIMKSQLFPNPKALIPIFLSASYLAFLRYYRDWKKKHLGYAGLFLGLMMWTHYGVALPVLIAILLYSLFKFKEEKSLVLVPIIALVIFSPFIINVIANIEDGASLMVEGWNVASLSLSNTIRRIFPPVWGAILILLSLLYMNKAQDRIFWNFVLFVVIGIIGVNLLPSILFITTGIEIFPSRFAISLHYTYLLLYLCAILGLVESKYIRGNKKLVTYLISLIFLVYGSLSFVHYNFHNPSAPPFLPNYTYVEFEDLAGNYTRGLLIISSWIRNNTGRDDCLIGYPYTLEWIAGFTGRPVVAVSYGHGNPFLNMRQRRHDIKEFFRDPSKRTAIAEKYGVKYVILDPYAREYYNVTVANFSDNFRVAFHWWEFYILEVS